MTTFYPANLAFSNRQLAKLNLAVRSNQEITFRLKPENLSGPHKIFLTRTQINKLEIPKSKSGWTLPGHRYTGPYNPLSQQLGFDPETGKILESYVKPTGKTDAIAAQHDVDYSLCDGKKNPKKCKNKADRKMVKALDAVPWKDRQWDHALARNVINTKQKLGLETKNANRRRNGRRN